MYLYRSKCVTERCPKDPKESDRQEKQGPEWRTTDQWPSTQGWVDCSPCTLLSAPPACSKMDPCPGVCLLHAQRPRSYGKPGLLDGQAERPCPFFSSNKKARMLFLHLIFLKSQLQYIFRISKSNFKLKRKWIHVAFEMYRNLQGRKKSDFNEKKKTMSHS